MKTGQEKAEEAFGQVEQVVLGKRKQIEEIFLAFLADGHVLLEDIPGVGKTTLAKAFARVLGLDYRRIQFTPDVMASDLTGFSIYSREKEEFVYQPGNVFCNLLLADELNRTSPKTQSALLEAMEERQCTAEGITRKVPNPFLVYLKAPFLSYSVCRKSPKNRNKSPTVTSALRSIPNTLPV